MPQDGRPDARLRPSARHAPGLAYGSRPAMAAAIRPQVFRPRPRADGRRFPRPRRTQPARGAPAGKGRTAGVGRRPSGLSARHGHWEAHLTTDRREQQCASSDPRRPWRPQPWSASWPYPPVELNELTWPKVGLPPFLPGQVSTRAAHSCHSLLGAMRGHRFHEAVFRGREASSSRSRSEVRNLWTFAARPQFLLFLRKHSGRRVGTGCTAEPPSG